VRARPFGDSVVLGWAGRLHIDRHHPKTQSPPGIFLRVIELAKASSDRVGTGG
jgi:hypothetical protein